MRKTCGKVGVGMTPESPTPSFEASKLSLHVSVSQNALCHFRGHYLSLYYFPCLQYYIHL